MFFFTILLSTFVCLYIFFYILEDIIMNGLFSTDIANYYNIIVTLFVELSHHSRMISVCACMCVCV